MNESLRVFISYSHADGAWRDRLARALRAHGLDVWDDRAIRPGDAWHASIQHALDACDAVVCLITANYLRSDYVQEAEIPVIQSRRASAELPVIPILVEECAWREVPWLTVTQLFPPDGRTVARDFAGRENELFLSVAERLLARLETSSATIAWSPASVDLGNLRRSGTIVFGRDRWFDDLDNAFNAPDTHVVSLVGPSGVGKSTLLEAWLERLAREDYRYARRVFGWSFTTSLDGRREAGADRFVSHLFRWLGGEPELRGTGWERGSRLARLLREEPTLLILDSVESLLAVEAEGPASVKDTAVARLLAELARDNRCLVVVASRRAVSELDAFAASVRHEQLEVLSPQAGAQILKERGLTGERLEDLSRMLGHHSLALTLLAGFLRSIPSERWADALAAIPPHDSADGLEGHPRRVLDAFAARFRDGPELQLLGALSLFDGPADPGALDAVRRAAVPGLTDRLARLPEPAWDDLVSRLQDQDLVMSMTSADAARLDLHPLVRAHFEERLRSAEETAWRRGHDHLCRHFSGVAPTFPRTVDGIRPLYHAVRHGCAAGLHQEVLDEVFWKRILRGDEQFSWKTLGLIQSDLGAISNFFSTPWSRVEEGIASGDAGFVIGQAGIYLGMAGRLTETVPLFRTSVERDVAANRITNASVTAGNLSHVLLLMGDLAGSIEAGERSVRYADEAGDTNEQRISRTHLGHALHHASQLDEAEARFREAETIQREHSGSPFLCANDGLQYGDLLISRGRWSDAQARAIANLAPRVDTPDREPEGQDHDLLASARATLAAIRAGQAGELDRARTQVETAVAMIRDSQQLDVLPLGLLTRADLYRHEYRQHEALDDLEETLALARRCEMRTIEADALVLHAQVLAELGRRSAASRVLTTATDLTADLDYHRHNAELVALRRRLGGATPT